MLYLWPSCSSMKGMHPGFGVMTSPAMGAVAQGIKEGRPWAYDNGNGFKGRPFDPGAFFKLLERLRPWRSTCLFVVCPDRKGDAVETLALWRQWAPRIDGEGWPLAFVAQNGQEGLDWPVWSDETDWFDGLEIDPDDHAAWEDAKAEWADKALGFDWLFLGGTDDWRPAGGVECIEQMRQARPWHAGRVNGVGRMRYYEQLGVRSCDGTCANYEPDVIRRRFTKALQEPTLAGFKV